MALASAALVSAESILALTPIAIKKTPLDPISAIWSRTLSSTGLGYAISSDRSLPRSEYEASAALGYINLLHVASSYEAFRHLPGSQAMSLLYTYPVWNLLMVSYFNHEKITWWDFACMGVAGIGSVLLNMDPGTAAENSLGRKAHSGWGVFMGLIMALTESGMHTLLKHLNWLDPAKSVWVLNASASGWLAVFHGLQELFGGEAVTGPTLRGGTWWDAIWLTLFHSVTLFSGYWLRFYAVPRLSTVTYSILSYAGLIASFLFGSLIMGERPGWISVLGAAIIVGAGITLDLSGAI